MRYRDLRGVLASSVAVMAVAVATPAVAQVRTFNVPAQAAATGIPALAKQADIQLLVASDAVSGKTIRAVKGRMTVDEAIRRVVDDAGLRVVNSDGRTYTLAPRELKRTQATGLVSTAQATQQAPQYDEIIVTAQKKEERIQNVPISMSAFSAEALDDYKIESGSELLRAVPNVSFSKSNFAGYNFSIRGIGTKALSVGSDPAVAISFNNTPLLRNRLFEQEYFDVQRVEVLRGPQGTLYGRNATGGVVNMITNQPELDDFFLSAKGEVGNYNSRRLSGMLNVPIGSNFSLRFAGALTKRDGYDFNTVTNSKVNGRDLWSSRISARWEPTDRFKVNAVWEHFEEDDDRSRTGKQLCTRDPGPTSFGGKDISLDVRFRGVLSQGCLPKSIYDDAAYDVPNAFSLPHVAAGALVASLGYAGNRGPIMRLIDPTIDPYAGVKQSKNLREISTAIDPVFRANNNVFQLNIDFEVSDELKLISSASYSDDKYYSTQDYNRINSNDAFNDSSLATNTRGQPLPTNGISPGGVLNDPQLGLSSKILAMDMVKSKSSQWYQELRAQSDFQDNFNFSLGANYLKFKISEDYYVFSNLFTALARTALGTGGNGNVVRDCDGWVGGSDCTYVDPNPIEKLNGDGHNYFRSQNVGSTQSYALFGEVYVKPSQGVKITAGVRYTNDEKIATPIESQLLLGTGIFGYGLINQGYIVSPDIRQSWDRLTGRIVVDWTPDLSFTEKSMMYASYSRGYKGGGANPPGIGADPDVLTFFPLPKVFEPETVNAFEIGMKNEFGDGGVLLNLNAFYYDYKNYQVSQIVDRIALNETYDAEVWGAEAEFVWRPTRRMRLNANVGYLKTRIANGMKSIDVMNRTQGDENWVLLKPWIQLASNCIAPRALVDKYFNHPLSGGTTGDLSTFCGGQGQKNFNAGGFYSDRFGIIYNPETDAPNSGRGFDAMLGGNELPNSPNWTMNLGYQYVLPINNWDLSFRADYYRQGKSWARVYNTEIDRLKSWDNFNILFNLSNEKHGLDFQFYVKNLFNDTPITDIFLNSDDSGLTANVFTLDPRVIGFSVSKKI